MADDLGRLRSLDGLRGVAAIVVLFHHLSLIAPGPASIVMERTSEHPAVGSFDWLLFATPLHILVSGPEAVVVFFVLSGLVLTRGVGEDPRRFDWFDYYPRRLLRLGLPVAASVVFAAILVLISSQDPAKVASPWLSSFSVPNISLARAIAHIDLIWGDVAINNPLWSLHYETAFSVLLPLFVLIARWCRGSLLVIVASAALTSIGVRSGSGGFSYLPMFLCGAVLVARLPQMQIAMGRLRGPAVAGVMLISTLVLIEARWIIWSLGVSVADAQVWGFPATALGSTLLVGVVATSPSVRRVFELRLVQYLGRISFSLYLVHVPIIIATASFLRTRPLVVTAVVSCVISLAVAALFARFIELPAHRLSRAVGRRASMEMARLP